MKLFYPDAETGEEITEWHNWKVVATDKYSSDRIIDVYLDEWYDNTMEDSMIAQEEDKPNPMIPHIEGPAQVYVFDENLLYTVVGYDKGSFKISVKDKAKIISTTNNSCILNITTGKMGEFELIFTPLEGDRIIQKIKIQSF
jgi:hypothetical protein